MATAVVHSLSTSSRTRWTWLWSKRSDLAWNFLPFWLLFPFAAALYGARSWGDATVDNPLWNFTMLGKPIHLLTIGLYFYGPLVDAPHLWATIARTYADKDEWAARKGLFLGSLAWLVIGPVVILVPYGLRAAGLIAQGAERGGWLLWSHFFTFYALFHINKQHWGFVALYKRKNADFGDERENRVDRLFFYVAIWLPYAAMVSAPWYVDYDGQALAVQRMSVFGWSAGLVLHRFCHVAFFAACVGYAAFQLRALRRGQQRNGPKLAYLATIIPLYYLAFAIHPVVAAFWVPIIGIGHCAQYHRVVWGYGRSQYAGKAGAERRLPSAFFESLWLYAVLGVLYGVLTLQGPGATTVKGWMANALDLGFLRHAFPFLDHPSSVALGFELAAAFVGGVRLHHFYVDSKIWRVSQSRQLAKNLNM